MANSGILAKSKDLQTSFHATASDITIGIDLGDRFSHSCVLGADGEILTEGRVRSTPDAIDRHFQELPPCRIAIEVGGHSRWLSQLLIGRFQRADAVQPQLCGSLPCQVPKLRSLWPRAWGE